MLIPFEIMSEPRIKNRGLRHDAGASFVIGPNEGTQFYEEATLDGCIGCSGNVAGFLALWRFLHSVCQPDAFPHRNVCTIGRFSWRLLSFLAKRAMSPIGTSRHFAALQNLSAIGVTADMPNGFSKAKS